MMISIEDSPSKIFQLSLVDRRGIWPIVVLFALENGGNVLSNAQSSWVHKKKELQR
jgi:hypothetical protein